MSSLFNFIRFLFFQLLLHFFFSFFSIRFTRLIYPIIYIICFRFTIYSLFLLLLNILILLFIHVNYYSVLLQWDWRGWSLGRFWCLNFTFLFIFSFVLILHLCICTLLWLRWRTLHIFIEFLAYVLFSLNAR